MRNLIICILLLFPCLLGAQESDKRLRFNAGLKVGFQAVTYNDPTFGIEGYTYNSNTYFGSVNLHNGLEVDALAESIARNNKRKSRGFGS